MWHSNKGAPKNAGTAAARLTGGMTQERALLNQKQVDLCSQVQAYLHIPLVPWGLSFKQSWPEESEIES